MIDDLAASAKQVLESNWLGESTKPSAHLYPHQWSWDSAFIAIGNARCGHTDRALTELRTLFAAQWSTGMVPHMVFDQTATGYYPSADLWGTRPIAEMPSGVLTSGICQPPIHALAVREVARDLDADDARTFFRELYEPLAAWHDYLHRSRAVDSPLLELWHPWEAGMDNSPVWDAALNRLSPDVADIPEYRRVDTDHAGAAARPTADQYDRYVYLVEQLRRVEYQPSDPTALPFRVCDVLFNTTAAQADAELAAIARDIGAPHADNLLERSLALTDAIDSELWAPELGLYVDLDRTVGEQIDVPIAGGLMPLLLGIEPDRARRVRDTMTSRFAVTDSAGSGLVIPTVPVDHPTFDADRYWSGPAWINIMWLLIRGLRNIGDEQLAARMRDGALGLVATNGSAEYFNPLTGEARGASEFSWTAALTLDLLRE